MKSRLRGLRVSLVNLWDVAAREEEIRELETKINQKTLGILCGVSAGVVWGFEAVLGKFLFSSFTVIQVTTSELLFATVTAFVYALVRKEKWSFQMRDVKYLLIVGIVGTILAPLLYFYGLTQTLAINATLIAHLQPFFVAILGFYFLGEKMQKHDVVASVLIVFAAVLITSRTVYNLANFKIGNFGDLMILVATVSWAIVAIPGKQLVKDLTSSIIVRYRFLIASLFMLPLAVCLNQLVINSIYQVLLGVLVGLGYILYYEGLKRLKTSQVALTELSSPFFAAILARLLINESITIMQIIGALLLLLGLYMLTQEPIEEQNASRNSL